MTSFAFQRGTAIVTDAGQALFESVLVQDEYTNLPCDCGRGPILEGNGTPDVCAACYDEAALCADCEAMNAALIGTDLDGYPHDVATCACECHESAQ